MKFVTPLVILAFLAVSATAFEVKDVSAQGVNIDYEAETVCVTWKFKVCLSQSDINAADPDDGSESGAAVYPYDDDWDQTPPAEPDDGDPGDSADDDLLDDQLADGYTIDLSELVRILQENAEIDTVCSWHSKVVCTSFLDLRANSNGEDTVEMYAKVYVTYDGATESDEESSPVPVALPPGP